MHYIEIFQKSKPWIIKHTDIDMARLKIALDELYYIESCDIKSYRNALACYYGEKIPIVGERGIQKGYKDLTSLVQGKGKFVKDIGEDRIIIDELKDFLSNWIRLIRFII